MQFLSVLIVFTFLNVVVDGASRAERAVACPKITNFSGKVKYRRKGTRAVFKCPKKFDRYGAKAATCQEDGTWSEEPPLCIRQGCLPLDPSQEPNLDMEVINGALVKFSCLQHYKLIGQSEIYCDGVDWSAPIPRCAAPHELTECDFEIDFCGWTQDDTDERDWERNTGPTQTGNTGPKNDHTYETTKNGHYIFFEASAPTTVGDQAKLLSPVYTPDLSPMCFDFWYHILGPDEEGHVGSLEVYVIDQSQFEDEAKPLFVREGNQGDQWHRGEIFINKQDEPYQIMIVGKRALSYFSDIAVDDVRLYDCATTTKARRKQPTTTETTTESTTESTTETTTRKLKPTKPNRKTKPTTPKPIVKTTKPAITTTKAAITTTKPAVTTTKPTVTTTKLVVTSTKPTITTTKPAATTTNPLLSTSKQAKTSATQTVASSNPNDSTTTPPITSTDSPVSTTKPTAIVTTKPASVTMEIKTSKEADTTPDFVSSVSTSSPKPSRSTTSTSTAALSTVVMTSQTSNTSLNAATTMSNLPEPTTAKRTGSMKPSVSTDGIKASTPIPTTATDKTTSASAKKLSTTFSPTTTISSINQNTSLSTHFLPSKDSSTVATTRKAPSMTTTVSAFSELVSTETTESITSSPYEPDIDITKAGTTVKKPSSESRTISTTMASSEAITESITASSSRSTAIQTKSATQKSTTESKSPGETTTAVNMSETAQSSSVSTQTTLTTQTSKLNTDTTTQTTSNLPFKSTKRSNYIPTQSLSTSNYSKDNSISVSEQRSEHPEDDTLKPLMIGLGVGILAGLIIIGVIAYVCMRRRKFYTSRFEDELKPITNSASVQSLNGSNGHFYQDEEYESES